MRGRNSGILHHKDTEGISNSLWAWKVDNWNQGYFLYSQLQAGLKLSLMESPVVSGSLSYKQFCVAAKQEEQWLVELRRHRQYFERTAKNDERSQINLLPPRPSQPTLNNALVDQQDM